MQGARIFRNEAFLSVRRPSALLRAMSLSNGRRTFYKAVNIAYHGFSLCSRRSTNSLGSSPDLSTFFKKAIIFRKSSPRLL